MKYTHGIYGIYDNNDKGKLVSRFESEAAAKDGLLIYSGPENDYGAALRVEEIKPKTKYIRSPGQPWKFA